MYNASDFVLVSRYRDMLAHMVALEAGKLLNFSFQDFFEPPILKDFSTCCVQVDFHAVYHADSSGDLFDVSVGAIITPSGFIHLYESSADPLDLDLPFN